MGACALRHMARRPQPSHISIMPLSSRHGDPMLEQIARETFALFPHCAVCGERIEQFEDADVRVHVLRVVHRQPCAASASDAAPAGGDGPA